MKATESANAIVEESSSRDASMRNTVSTSQHQLIVKCNSGRILDEMNAVQSARRCFFRLRVLDCTGIQIRCQRQQDHKFTSSSSSAFSSAASASSLS